MSPQQQQERGVKRKKPPTFQHLPAERAKKLKRSWVEVQKIKSKWKAQKRKEGLVAPRSHDGSSGDEESEAESSDEVPPATKHSKDRHGQSASKQQAVKHADKAQEKNSLRELQKQAYSKASLHNHKSRPLNRYKGPASSRGQDAGRGGRGRGATPRGRGREKGQPDMGLRMKAMLEKIKQDLT
ncbi:hypothetical protein GY45DRAFT_1249524 [Cubamyces sp. BRFM 1775]|nr:hypothetical protein GY45DRAFT_1249524 [Cubamyces sp. BRFM 1775]